LQSFVIPEIIFIATSSGIVEIAIKYRQAKVFSLLRKMPIICKLLVLELDKSQNTTSHIAARFSSQIDPISGAAF
jgi:hypothetical protein